MNKDFFKLNFQNKMRKALNLSPKPQKITHDNGDYSVISYDSKYSINKINLYDSSNSPKSEITPIARKASNFTNVVNYNQDKTQTTLYDSAFDDFIKNQSSIENYNEASNTQNDNILYSHYSHNPNIITRQIKDKNGIFIQKNMPSGISKLSYKNFSDDSQTSMIFDKSHKPYTGVLTHSESRKSHYGTAYINGLAIGDTVGLGRAMTLSGEAGEAEFARQDALLQRAKQAIASGDMALLEEISAQAQAYLNQNKSHNVQEAIDSAREKITQKQTDTTSNSTKEEPKQTNSTPSKQAVASSKIISAYQSTND